MTTLIGYTLCRSPAMENLSIVHLQQQKANFMTTPIPPLQLDTHREKSSSICQCIVKSTCCSTTADDDENQTANIVVDVDATDEKTCCIAKRCCVIQ